jgi:TolA-binding protein
MKSAFIRMMAVAVFATSISAFAMSEDPKAAKDKNSDSANVGTAVESNVSATLDELLAKVDQLQGEVQQLQAKDKESQGEQETKQEDAKRKIDQQNKEWDHSLLGIYGG